MVNPYTAQLLRKEETDRELFPTRFELAPEKTGEFFDRVSALREAGPRAQIASRITHSMNAEELSFTYSRLLGLVERDSDPRWGEALAVVSRIMRKRGLLAAA